MIDKNFIPTPILTERRRRARKTWWVVACAAYTLCVAMLILWLRDPLARSRELDFRVQLAASELQGMEASLNRTRLELSRAREVLRSRAHLTGRPNWGTFLSLLGERRPSGLFLTHCALRSDLGNLPIRVTIRGLAQTQAAVSSYVIALERLGLFDAITIQHVRREPVGQTTGLVFEVLCEASGGFDE